MTSKSSQRLLVSIYLLTGYYEQAYHICLNKGSLGWTCGNNPKGLVIPFFLILLSGEMNSAATPNLERLWDEAVTIACDNGSIDLQERFHQVMDGVFKHLQLPEKDELKYLKWCITEAGSRVDAIVGGKHRGSYHKAATVIVAVAEVLVKRGSKLEGSALIRQYYQKYPRHRAFKEELNIAVAKSGVYSN